MVSSVHVTPNTKRITVRLNMSDRANNPRDDNFTSVSFHPDTLRTYQE